MKVIYDVAEHQKKIKDSIRKHGHFAEHNFVHYLYSETKPNRNVLFDFGNSKSVLARCDKEHKVWALFPNGILAPEKERIDLLLEASYYILKKQKAKKFSVEVSEEIRKGLLNRFRTTNGIKACNCNCILYWPLYNMDLWDAKLNGGKFKKLRNVSNRFYRKNKVRVFDSRLVPKEKLMDIVTAWTSRRRRHDRVHKDYYFNLINNNFKGVDIAKTMYVNGKPCTITAGWKIPNSNNYYSSVGIMDYSRPDLGEVANMDDLNRLKECGYDYVDFGGSEKSLLYFKKKFKPETIYKTYIFSIVRSK